MSKNRIVQRLVCGLVWLGVAALAACGPAGHGTERHQWGAVSAACMGTGDARCVAVDLSTPAGTFRSYLDSYEKRCGEGMYVCMSQRLRRCCGSANCAEFCSMMQAALAKRDGEERVLTYYRNLIPVIQHQFETHRAAGYCFEIAFAGPTADDGTTNPSHLAFIQEGVGWRVDVFEVYVPPS